MGEAIGEILPSAVGVAISVLPIIAVILLLFTPRAASNGIGLLVGWIVGLSLVGAIFLVVGQGLSDSDSQASTSGGIKIAAGALFLFMAVRQWRKRPAEGEDVEMPRWMAAIDRFNAPKSFATGFVLSAVNPKNLLLTVAAALSISSAGLGVGDEIAVLAVFVVLGSVTIAAPVFAYLLLRERIEQQLQSLKQKLTRYNAPIMATILLVLGAKLIGDGIRSLS